MSLPRQNRIKITATIQAPIDQVWTCWTTPKHITKWNAAVDEWHCPTASNDLRAGGRFSYHMAARDGSMKFDFSGTYDVVTRPKLIQYTLDDDRQVSVRFKEENGQTTITEVFEAETENPVDMQKSGWQAILDRFKHHVESL